jgi:hypothetical protein
LQEIGGSLLGVFYYSAHDVRECLVLWVYPDNGGTLNALGYIYMQLGQINNSKTFIKKVTNNDLCYAKTFLYQVVYHFFAFVHSAALSVYYSSNHIHMSLEIEI